MRTSPIIKTGPLFLLFIVIELIATPVDSTDTNKGEKKNRLNVVYLDGKTQGSADMATFKNLRRKAAAGTSLYFSGVALNYTMIIVAANSDMSQEDSLGLIFPGILSRALESIGTPIACIAATKASKLCTGGYPGPSNIGWGLYGGGWACEALSTIIGLVNLVGGSENAEEMAIAAIAITGVRDVLWGVACIFSINHVRNVEKLEQPKKVSFYPLVSPKGSIGLGLSYRF